MNLALKSLDRSEVDHVQVILHCLKVVWHIRARYAVWFGEPYVDWLCIRENNFIVHFENCVCCAFDGVEPYETSPDVWVNVIEHVGDNLDEFAVRGEQLGDLLREDLDWNLLDVNQVADWVILLLRFRVFDEKPLMSELHPIQCADRVLGLLKVREPDKTVTFRLASLQIDHDLGGYDLAEIREKVPQVDVAEVRRQIVDKQIGRWVDNLMRFVPLLMLRRSGGTIRLVYVLRSRTSITMWVVLPWSRHRAVFEVWGLIHFLKKKS